jgi:hypothetical protein
MLKEVVDCLVNDGLPVTMVKTHQGLCYFAPLNSGKVVKFIPPTEDQKANGVEFLVATDGHQLNPYLVRQGDDLCDALSGWCQPAELKHIAWQNLMEDYRQPPLNGPR